MRGKHFVGNGEAVVPTWHAPKRPLSPPYQWRRGSLRARAPEQLLSNAPARLPQACPRTLLGGRPVLRTNGVLVPFVLERLSNTPARPPQASPRTPDLSRARAPKDINILH